MSKKTIVFDFDGVIHKYSKGWQDGSIYDEPNYEVVDVINKLRFNNYEVVIVSTRCSTEQGVTEMINWLNKYNIEVDRIDKHKPPALVYIDDRAICFDSDYHNLLNEIVNFKPAQSKRTEYENLNELELLMCLKQRNDEFKLVNDKFSEKYGTKDALDDSVLKERMIINIKLMDDWINSVKKYL